jgi:hypothetical protein
MRVIKLGIISLVVFGILFYAFSLFIPSRIRISRAINIAVQKDTLASRMADLRSWKDWNEMVNNDENSNPKYTDRTFDGGVLSVKMVYASADSIRTVWQFRNTEPIMSGFNLVQSLSDTTVAQWYFDFNLKWYPWEKFGSIIFDQQLGPPMEKSLNNLKTTLENQSQ